MCSALNNDDAGRWHHKPHEPLLQMRHGERSELQAHHPNNRKIDYRVVLEKNHCNSLNRRCAYRTMIDDGPMVSIGCQRPGE
jgi:hypothetical protein